jgi:hypothetical protein
MAGGVPVGCPPLRILQKTMRRQGDYRILARRGERSGNPSGLEAGSHRGAVFGSPILGAGPVTRAMEIYPP